MFYIYCVCDVKRAAVMYYSLLRPCVALILLSLRLCVSIRSDPDSALDCKGVCKTRAQLFRLVCVCVYSLCPSQWYLQLRSTHKPLMASRPTPSSSDFPLPFFFWYILKLLLLSSFQSPWQWCLIFISLLIVYAVLYFFL